MYLADAGLACRLPGIDSASELAKSPFLGTLFQGFIASEIVKARVNAGRRRELYYFRDEQGLEVDFLVPGRGGSVSLVECKAGRTATPAMAAPVQRLAEALKKKRPGQPNVDRTFKFMSRKSVMRPVLVARNQAVKRRGHTGGHCRQSGPAGTASAGGRSFLKIGNGFPIFKP